MSPVQQFLDYQRDFDVITGMGNGNKKLPRSDFRLTLLQTNSGVKSRKRKGINNDDQT